MNARQRHRLATRTVNGLNVTSLPNYLGKEIADVVGDIWSLGGTPTFRLQKIVFTDGTELWIEGEHDWAYIPASEAIEGLEEKTLMEIVEGNE